MEHERLGKKPAFVYLGVVGGHAVVIYTVGVRMLMGHFQYGKLSGMIYFDCTCVRIKQDNKTIRHFKLTYFET